MKKSMPVVLAVVLLALFSLSGQALADSADPRTFVLSNERGPAELQGGLIDQLIAAGHGDDNLYEVLQLLAADPASGIPADFVASVGNNPPGSEAFTAALSDFAGLNGPVCINADGTLGIQPIFGRDYDGDAGFVTNKVHYLGIALVNLTLAESPAYYIDAGSGGPSPIYYKAIGIAYANTSRSFVISNEAPGYLIDKLIAAGHGSDNLYQVLQFLAARPGSGIPADFVTEVGNNLPGSEVFTATLSNFGGLNGPVCINADGTVSIQPIFGRDLDGHAGYVTHTVNYSGIGSAKFTMATSPTDYVHAGEKELPPGGATSYYLAIGVAWADAASPASIPTLNEWGMILLSLALAGAGLVYMKRQRRNAL